MKAVILAGGFGTRLSEETSSKPKPMVEIGGRPILMHIMEYYASHGIREFYIACGYLSHYIKSYFVDFHYHQSDLSVSLADGKLTVHNRRAPDWIVHCIDTGLTAQTGGRLKAMANLLRDGPFLCTYGDGLSNVDITALMAFHKSNNGIATVTAVHPPARFGLLNLDGDRVTTFAEKLQTKTDWINGGFFVFEPAILDYIENEDSSLEMDVLERVATEGRLCAFRHDGFFQPMDTLREKQMLERMWKSGNAPWATGNATR